jgi:uncharacterized protein (TIGR02118 family)
VVKVIVLLPRRADMSPEAFGQHLRETHLPLVTKLPGLRRLVVNWVLPDPNGSPPAYDAVAEDWFDDAAAMGAAFASPEGQAVAADVPNYLDPSPLRAPGRGGGGRSPADRIRLVLRRLRPRRRRFQAAARLRWDLSSLLGLDVITDDLNEQPCRGPPRAWGTIAIVRRSLV